MPNKNGLHLITPTSTAKTGTGSTATINTNGSVTFSSCETLSLNGVFSADYDNYMIVMRGTPSASGYDIQLRLRSSGTDNSTASSYVGQYLYGNGTSVTGGRETSNQVRINTWWTTQREGHIINLYGPFLTQPTAGRSITVNSYTGASIFDMAWTHNQSTSYDGISFYVTSTLSITGLVGVYGMRN